MASERTKVDVGFGLGQVISVKLSESRLGDLRKAVEKNSGWYDLKTAEGSVALNVATVVFLRVADGEPRSDSAAETTRAGVKRLLLLIGFAVLAASYWWRKNPSACPYGQHFWVEAPHPLITRERLRAVLRAAPGERGSRDRARHGLFPFEYGQLGSAGRHGRDLRPPAGVPRPHDAPRQGHEIPNGCRPRAMRRHSHTPMTRWTRSS